MKIKTQVQRRLPIFGNAALYLFIEQITVGSGAGQRQHQNIILNAVDEQPVRLDMAFPVADPVTGQSVVAVFVGQRLTKRKMCDNIF